MKNSVAVLIILSVAASGLTQPQPGDVFREYRWTHVTGDAGGSLRVGGRLGTTNWGTQIINGCWQTPDIELVHEFELEGAVKAEINIEKILCHEDTRGLAISVNGGDWIVIPEAGNIPEPQWSYQHHIYPTVPLSLHELKEGTGNYFCLKVDTTHTWNWPQNLIYGVHFRVYYDPDKVNHPSGRILKPRSGEMVGQMADLEIEAACDYDRIKEVDYVGLYDDVNWEGDGIYRQWHGHFYHGDLIHHIGTTKTAPYRLRWDTSWLPDQELPMQIAARIVDDSGMIYMTEAVTGLGLQREDFSVELCKPYDVPMKWLTRKGEAEEKFAVNGDPKKAVAARLVWSSWSPGYMNGVFINGIKVFDSEGPHYKYYDHCVNLSDTTPLVKGTNVLKTGKTPLYDGHMVHGMEVNWPGIMVLIKYRK